jgi:uncharacterized protein (DUF697 family)
MSAYDGQMGSEFGEFGEFGEMAEGLDAHEQLGEFGEFGETTEGPEAHEQFLGDILGSVLGGEVPLNEGQEIELASELMGVTNEQELEQFLGNLFHKVAKGVGGFIKSPIGRSLGGILKGVAKKALPVVGGALGSMVAPGIGTALGSKLGSMASGLFEVGLEGLPAEQAEFEVARRYVRLASSAAQHAAMARPRPGVSPIRVARAAVARAARTNAPGLYRHMIRRLATTPSAAARLGIRPQPPHPGAPAPMGARPARPHPGYRPYPGYGIDGAVDSTFGPMAAFPDGAADSTFPTTPDYTTAGIPDGWPEPVMARGQGGPLSGRWVRRGRKILVIGV